MAKSQKMQLGRELGVATIGMALGGVLGMLFAPKSGKETRKELAGKGRKLVASAAGTTRKAGKAVKAARTTAKRK